MAKVLDVKMKLSGKISVAPWGSGARDRGTGDRGLAADWYLPSAPKSYLSSEAEELVFFFFFSSLSLPTRAL